MATLRLDPDRRRHVQWVDGVGAGAAAFVVAVLFFLSGPLIVVGYAAALVGALAWRRTAPILSVGLVEGLALVLWLVQVMYVLGANGSLWLAVPTPLQRPLAQSAGEVVPAVIGTLPGALLPLALLLVAVLCVSLHSVTVHGPRSASVLAGAAAVGGGLMEAAVLVRFDVSRGGVLLVVAVIGLIPVVFAWGLGALRVALREEAALPDSGGIPLGRPVPVRGLPPTPPTGSTLPTTGSLQTTGSVPTTGSLPTSGSIPIGGPAARLFSERLDRWLQSHVSLVDATAAGGCALVFGALEGAADFWRGFIFTVLLFGALAWRRTDPVRALVAVTVTGVALWTLDLTTVLARIDQVGPGESVAMVVPPAPVIGVVAMFVVLYSVTAYASRRASFVALSIAVLGAVMEVGILSAALIAASDWASVLLGLGFAEFAVLATWAFGALRRARWNSVAQLRERARLLEVERGQQARLAASAERTRIAREMHDVVAHSLAVVIAQADGGRYAAQQRPEAAQEALQVIGETARRALAETRQLLGVLRADGAQDAPTPQPDVDQIRALVEQVGSGGLAVSLSVQGTSRPVSQGLGLTAYRIVQEALTNVLKHAGPVATARVVLSWADDLLEILVIDDGRGAAAGPPEPGGGNGIVGMRERATLYGGRLDAGPAAGGGFVVRALLPIRVVPGSAARPGVPSTPEPPPAREAAPAPARPDAETSAGTTTEQVRT